MKPKLLITARKELLDNQYKLFVNEDYCQALGDCMCLMATFLEEDDIKWAAQVFDGLLVTGGGDIDPSYYGQVNRASKEIDFDVDETDLLLVQAFVRAGKPILGICRGLQMINVALGGSLIQDIPSELETIIKHSPTEKLTVGIPINNHLIKVVPNTTLYGLLGSDAYVNSYHHQAIDKLAYGITVSATSADGVIEAIEYSDNVLALQWHPERMSDDSNQAKIFSWFIEKLNENKGIS